MDDSGGFTTATDPRLCFTKKDRWLNKLLVGYGWYRGLSKDDRFHDSAYGQAISLSWYPLPLFIQPLRLAVNYKLVQDALVLILSFDPAQKRILVNDRSRHRPRILDPSSSSQIHLWSKSKI